MKILLAFLIPLLIIDLLVGTRLCFLFALVIAIGGLLGILQDKWLRTPGGNAMAIPAFGLGIGFNLLSVLVLYPIF